MNGSFKSAPMQYRMWFQVMIKAVGLFLIALALPKLLTHLVYVLNQVMLSARVGTVINWNWIYTVQALATEGAQIAIGLYLLFGGKWVLKRCLPIDRYCMGCGYDISRCQSAECPECELVIPRRKDRP